MEDDLAPHNEFEAEVAGRFGILPNFFRSEWLRAEFTALNAGEAARVGDTGCKKPVE
jgi:hypothetical protein